MKRGIIFLLYVAGVVSPALAQRTIKGNVTDAKDKRGIANCAVFIDGSSAGTRTGNNGDFELSNIPAGQHDLIISRPGYQPAVFAITDQSATAEIKAALFLKEKRDEEYSDPQYRQKWIEAFRSGFLGFMGNSDKCVIKNQNVLRFQYDENTNKLRASAGEPLFIINNALGYEISYQLTSFEMDLGKGVAFYNGYSLFKEMVAKNKTQEERWARYRLEAYNGSFRHFVKSLYKNELSNEGFEMQQMTSVANAEKERVKNILKNEWRNKSTGANANMNMELLYAGTGLPKDSLSYYRHVMEQPDSFHTAKENKLTANDILADGEGAYKILSFTDLLSVSYHKKYYARVQVPKAPEIDLRSYIRLSNAQTVSIDEAGNYYAPNGMICQGYWGWATPVSDMLPCEYSSIEK